MQFDEIEIHNLFSYYGTQVFDLRIPNPNHNIVIISGRNGYGKTSFINSVKLLFGGITDEIRTLQFGSDINEKQFVMGVDESWIGIMNRQARLEGQNKCWVQIRWREALGEVKARRSWTLYDYSFTTNIGIETSSELIIDADACQAFLEERLPRDYIQFFFFDGEQIRALAEANRTLQMQQVEKILNISPFETLQDYLNKAIAQWKRSEMDVSAQSKLKVLEKDKAVSEHNKIAKQGEMDDLADDINDLERKIAEENNYLESLRAYNYLYDEGLLKRDRERLEDDLDILQHRLIESLPVDVPLIANPSLVEKGVYELRRMIESQSFAQVNLLEDFRKDLPHDLFDKPPYPHPPLTESQKLFYKNRLIKLLQAYIPEPEHITDSIFHMETSKIKILLKVLEFYSQADSLRGQYAHDLREISQMKRKLSEIEQQLEDSSNLRGSEREIYRQRKAANDERRELLGNKKRRLVEIEKEISKLINEINNKEKEITNQEESVKLNDIAIRKVSLARNLKELFREFKDNLKIVYQADIEKTVNFHFRQLMSSHQMIDKIEIADDFSLHYKDKEGKSIGMASLSAGMKQLTATALLWALKDVSKKQFPIIIDTPLARVDREHQKNLLQNYYPHAGEQVIILPTDSELDQEKYSLLRPHIYKEYRLENINGESSKPLDEPMYQSVKEVSHG